MDTLAISADRWELSMGMRVEERKKTTEIHENQRDFKIEFSFLFSFSVVRRVFSSGKKKVNKSQNDCKKVEIVADEKDKQLKNINV